MTKAGVPTRIARRPEKSGEKIAAGICVVGSGADGISAALEAAAAGGKVVLEESAANLGGQAVNSAIGTFCGLYSNGPEITRLTYGVSDEILSDLLKDAAASSASISAAFSWAGASAEGSSAVDALPPSISAPYIQKY